MLSEDTINRPANIIPVFKFSPHTCNHGRRSMTISAFIFHAHSSKVERNGGIQTASFMYRHKLETRLFHKLWTQEISKVTDWPRRRAVAEFRLRVGHDCLGAHLHRTAIRTDPYSTLCSLHEPVDRNHLGQRTALSNKTECE
jgi:hypothetical protein